MKLLIIVRNIGHRFIYSGLQTFTGQSALTIPRNYVSIHATPKFAWPTGHLTSSGSHRLAKIADFNRTCWPWL